MRRHKMLQFCKYLSNFHEKLEHFKQKGKKKEVQDLGAGDMVFNELKTKVHKD